MKKILARLTAALLALTLLAAPASALTVDQALELLEETYYYDIPEEAYAASSLEELIQLLGDPYTEYMTAEQYQAFLDLMESNVDLVGIGVSVRFTGEGILVDGIVEGGAAQGAALQPGDLIVAIDGAPCVPAGEEHRDLLLGEEGSSVTITVLREGSTRNYTLTRRAIHIANTQVSLLEGGVGYVSCASFGTDTGALFAQGLQEYDSQVDCWLIDLRSNTGGYTASALDMLGALDGPGCYLYFEDNEGGVYPNLTYVESATDKPVIVLTDGYSASASELLAAGVRDTGRGLILGSRTYGKGVAQTILDQETDPDYFDGDGMKVTVYRFYSFGGTTTDRVGVIPTLLVDDRYTAAVAVALTGGSEEASSLCLVAGSDAYYVDPETDPEVLAALLEAVPPQVLVFYRGGENFSQCDPAYAAEQLGLEGFESRWFSDVADSPYAAAINAIGSYLLLNGTEPGVFSPGAQLTRAQLCTMLARVLNVGYSGPSQFTDVAEDAWYARGVNAMAELGLVNGVGGGRFDPDSPVTQEQFLTILGRTARYLNVALDAYGGAVDALEGDLPLGAAMMLAPYADWAKSSVAVLVWGVENGMDGRGDLLFAPLDQLTPSAPILREQAAAGLYAVLRGLSILP